MEAKNEALNIDIEKVIASKNKNLAKRLPRFFLNYIKRIIHQDEINTLLSDNSEYKGIEFASQVLSDLGVNFRVHNTTPFDTSKQYVIASNHPLGGLDGMILISMIGAEFGDVRFIVNDVLLYIEPFKSIFVPVNKYGKMKQDYANAMNEAFSSKAQILYFPAGLCSRLINGQIKDLEWKKTFISKAKEYNRDIIPIYFEGRNSMFFYRLAKIRKALGIKFNIETFYLPDELFKQKNRTFDIYIGEPINISDLTKERSAKESTLFVREKCYALKPKK